MHTKKLTMAAFLTDLWESIFTPGPTPTILIATNATFAALQITLLALLAGTYSVHFVVLSVLCAGLWWSINWFAAELKRVQEEEAREEKEKQKKATAEKKRLETREGDDEGDDTETEGGKTNNRDGAVGAESSSLSSQQQAKRRTGVARKGLDAGEGGGTSTSVSTEDEWEKVSEGEKESQ